MCQHDFKANTYALVSLKVKDLKSAEIKEENGKRISNEKVQML